MRKFLLLMLLSFGLVYADCSDGDEYEDGELNIIDIVGLVNIILEQ